MPFTEPRLHDLRNRPVRLEHQPIARLSVQVLANARQGVKTHTFHPGLPGAAWRCTRCAWPDDLGGGLRALEHRRRFAPLLKYIHQRADTPSQRMGNALETDMYIGAGALILIILLIIIF